MKYPKTESTVAAYARMLLMLDEGRFNREQIARELGISLAKATRCFVVLRTLFHMRIEFRTIVVVNEKTGRRIRGRTGVMLITDWGILPQQQTLEVCRQLVGEFGKNNRPECPAD